MIDLHCHILPGIDDGATDLDDSAAMVSQAEADGISAVCATPHIRHDHDVRIPELAGRIETLNRELRDRGLAVTILGGGEVAETALDGLDPQELAGVGLAGGRWILVEPRPGPLSESLLDAINRLSMQGFRAIVAHPERHLGPDSHPVLSAAIRAGALVQGTAAFLEEGTTSPLPDLAARGLVHVLGSDCHSSRAGRPMRLSHALAALARLPGMEPHIHWVAETAPAAIAADEDVVPPFAPA